jgi:GH43 family beta-xylosidase
VLVAACAPGALANPLVAGDHPDPSLIREADGWYTASTSGGWLPAFPILHSRDLRHWRQVGSVLARRPSWAAEDFWAPELQRRGGRVFAYYAALARDGRRCIAVASARAVRGPYRDHGPLACSRVGEIDPLPVTDEHGSDWLVWKRDGNSAGLPTPIVAAPLAPGGLSLAGPPVELFRADAPWERELVEAPELFRRRGLFYMVYSARRCCGRTCNYRTGVARSRALLGPWEKRPGPLLGPDALLRCPGHASVAEGPGGPLVAYHAYARGDNANRQLLLSRLGVLADGWPALRGAAAPPASAPAQWFGFAGSRLGRGWQWPAGPRPRLRVAGGRLRLRAGVLARPALAGRLRAEVEIPSRERGARPGLAAMASGEEGVGIELRGPRAVAWRLDDGRLSLIAARRVRLPQAARLRVTVGTGVRVAVRTADGWQDLAGRMPPPRWTSGPRVALTVRGRSRGGAEFDELWIRPR